MIKINDINKRSRIRKVNETYIIRNCSRIVLIIPIVYLLILSGCTKVALNAGATDYRVAVPGEGAFQNKYQNYSTAGEGVIKKGDSVSIHLQHAFIEDFSERLERITSKLSFTSVRGEIAILAKVYELENGKNISATTQAIKKEGRLIYYSEDVRSNGHPLNFSSLPVYGPITYGGNPIVIQFTILELDIAESDQIKGMLSTLAGIGKKAYPPSSPVLSVLDSVGSELLSGEQDDLEFQYVFVLHPEGGNNNLKYSYLRPGNYTLIKEEPNGKKSTTRFPKTEWAKMSLEDGTGRLLKDGNIFSDNTYLTIQINSGFSSVGLDVAQAFSEFETEINKSKDNAEFQEKLDSAIGKFIEKTKSKKTEDVIKRYFVRSLSLIQKIQLAAPTDVGVRSNAIAELFDILVSKRPIPEPATNDFDISQQDEIIKQLRLIAKNPFNISIITIRGTRNAGELDALLKMI